MVDLMFPSLFPDFKSQEFSSFGYWRESLIEIDGEEIKLFVKSLVIVVIVIVIVIENAPSDR